MFKKPEYLKNKILYTLVVLVCTLADGCASNDNESQKLVFLQEKQILLDNRSGINGLAGARVAELTPDGRKLLVASADDNSLAIFGVDSEFKLTFEQIFVNSSNVDGLIGAASLALSPDGFRAYVVSFYDSAIAVFERSELGNYQFIRSVKDNVPYQELFSDKESVKVKDTLGLLGAYDIAVASDNTQLFVASTASNAVSVFDINGTDKITSKQVIRDSDSAAYGLGGAVSVVVTPNNSQVIVAGFNENSITIFNRVEGQLEHSQTLMNGTHQIERLKAPQGLAVSPNGTYLYVACYESSSLLVFAKDKQNQYSLIQSITNSNENIQGLGGASYVTTSPDGGKVYVTSEIDKAVVTFTKLDSGKLTQLSAIKSEGVENGDEKNGAASVYASPDGSHLFVTTGKGDTLIVYELY